MSAALKPVDRPTIETLNSIRAKIVLLIDSVRWTQALIHNQGSNAALMPWPDIVARYNLLLSHTHAIVAQLAQPPYGAESDAAWTKNLAAAVVSPIQPVEPDKEWLVGMLLRTRQDVELENEAARLIATLPPSLQMQPPQPLAEQLPPDLGVKMENLQRVTDAHQALCQDVLKQARKLRYGSAHDEDDEEMGDGFSQAEDDDDGQPEYIWNMRLAEDDHEGQDQALFSPPPPKLATPLVDLKQVASFMRDGRKGSSFQ